MENEVKLPIIYIERMKAMLGEEEFAAFLDSYSNERSYGLRYNPLKITADRLQAILPIELEKVSWADEGFYYNGDEQPGKHVLHEAGAYYIQEPSAMAVVQLLDPKPGDYVLDLCAAPGGKSSQIAGRLMGNGLLVSNEIIPNRSKILSQNMERMGVANCVVTNEDSGRLSGFFPAFFDKIVVDAPCSGEGMFRKDAEAVAQWSPDNVTMCANRQDEILDMAACMLKPGGILVYSTCTFAEEEDEGSVSRFIERHPDYEVVTMERYWPHKVRGEGHFAAKLRKNGQLNTVDNGNEGLHGDKKLVKEIKQFLETEMGIDSDKLNGQVIAFKDQVYILPQGINRIDGLKVERPGIHIATIKKNRMEPAHALAMAIEYFDGGNRVAVTAKQAADFITGDTIRDVNPDIKGWCVVEYEGCSLGIAKAAGGVLKNHYPKGLRKNVVF